MNKQTGLLLLVVGGMILVAGIVIYFFHDKLNWVGKLPGDIRVQRPGFSLYIPITTMILASVVLSAILYFIRKYL